MAWPLVIFLCIKHVSFYRPIHAYRVNWPIAGLPELQSFSGLPKPYQVIHFDFGKETDSSLLVGM